MNLSLIKKQEIQKEHGFFIEHPQEEASSFATDHPHDDPESLPDDLLKSLSEDDLEEKEERDALDATEANLDGDHTALAASDEGSEPDTALSLYLREVGRIPLLTPTQEVSLALVVHQGKLELQQALQSNTLPNDTVMQQAKEAQRLWFVE